MGNISRHSKPILIVSSQTEELDLWRWHIGRYAAEFPLVRAAVGGSDALESVNDQLPACCVISYRLGDDSGLRLLKDIRQHLPAETLPIIMVGESSDEELVVESLQFGAQNYLLKDEITAARLYGAIWNAIRSSSMQKQINHLAHYDALTGLLNRSLLMNRLDQALKRCDRYQQRCALLNINIDGFKPINESYGHAVGDQLLQVVAERIKLNCRNTDSAARYGGDEFVVLLEHIDLNAGRSVAEKLLHALEAPYRVRGEDLSVSISVGLAVYPDTAANGEELLKQADQALVRAKKDTFSKLVCFSEQHRSQWQRQSILEKELPKAISRGDLALVYQPIVKADTFELKRLEVLSRWPRDDFAVSALELIDMIDRLNLVEPFHEWLFDQAFTQMRDWDREGVHPDLCLNVPANYCYSSTISRGIREVLAHYNIDPMRVELEITESTLMRHPDKSVRVLQALHDYGLRIAVDDFGTGYSSMAYLSRLPLDTLKIDRTFFLDNDQRDRNRKIIEAIAALGHSLELEIIAEGVETQFQLMLARSVGCDLLQGYYFGRPEFAGNNWMEYQEHFKHFSAPQQCKANK